MSTRTTKLAAARHEVTHAILALIAAIAVTAAGGSLGKLVQWIRVIADHTEKIQQLVVIDDAVQLQKVLESFLREFHEQTQAANAVDCAHVARQKIKRYIGVLRRE